MIPVRDSAGTLHLCENIKETIDPYYNVFPTVDSIADFMKRKHPELWKKVYTKQIDPPPSYYNFKLPAVIICSAVITAIQEAEDPRGSVIAALNIASAASVCQRYDFPTYYVSRNILAALAQTDPPSDMQWKDMMLPFDGMIFMLPKGWLRDPATHEEINFVGFGKLCMNERYRFPFPNTPSAQLENEKMTIFWSLGHGAMMQDVTFPTTQILKPPAAYFTEMNELYRHAIQEGDPYPLSPPSDDFGSQIAALVANLILLMLAQPELIERGGATKKILPKSGIRIHRPNFIGFKFTVTREHRGKKTNEALIQQELLEGKRIIKWAKGHFQTIRFGIKWQEKRVQWIKPYQYTRRIDEPEEEEK